MTIQDLVSKIVEVESFQTTFVTFKVERVTIRVNFYDKKEFRLNKGTTGRLQYFEKHPLLTNYNERFATTYINSKPKDFKKLSNNIQSAINELTLGWRSWTEYVTVKAINFTIDTFENNLKNGTGKLIEAPLSITEKVIALCDQQNVLTKTFEINLEPKPCKLIMIGNDFVIAKEFKSVV